MKRLQQLIETAQALSILEIKNSESTRDTVGKRVRLTDKWGSILGKHVTMLVRWSKDKDMADFKSEMNNAIKAYATAVREVDRLSGTMGQILKKMVANMDAPTIR